MKSSSLFCRLYILSEDALDVVQSRAASIFGVEHDHFEMRSTYLSASIMKNEDFSEDKLAEHGGFVFYPYTAEVDPVDQIVPDTQKVDAHEFLDDLSRLIVELRSAGYSVVASCSYEEEIAEKTGWNWSVSTPNHPK